MGFTRWIRSVWPTGQTPAAEPESSISENKKARVQPAHGAARGGKNCAPPTAKPVAVSVCASSATPGRAAIKQIQNRSTYYLARFIKAKK